MELTTLITLVSRETKISKIKLIGDFTRKYITEARLIIVKIAHDDLKLTHQEIGSAMGGRGKSWSCKAMIKFKENNIESSTEYQRIYSKFLTQSSLCDRKELQYIVLLIEKGMCYDSIVNYMVQITTNRTERKRIRDKIITLYTTHIKGGNY